MSSIREPKVTYNLITAPALVQDAPQKLLVIAQQITDTSPDGQLITNIGVSGEENTLFGIRSQMATGIREFRRINSVTQVDAIPLNDAIASVAAEGTLTFTSASTANQEFTFYIQSRRLHEFSITVADGDAASDTAAAVETAINNDTTILVTAVAIANVITLTSTLGGTSGNFVNFETAGNLLGTSITWTGFSGGTGNPDITNVFDVIGDTRYQWCITPSGYDKTILASFFDSRFNVTNNVLDGRALQTNTGDETSQIASVASLNSQNFVNFSNKEVINTFYTGGATKEYDFVMTAQFAAIAALRLTEGQNIANLLVGNAGAGDDFGGIWTAPIPYANTPFSNIAIADSHIGWTQAEQLNLNNNGCAFFSNNPSNTLTIVGEVVTTYLTDTLALPSLIWKYLTTVVTASVIREFYVNNNREEFAQTVLTSGDIVPNRKQTDIDTFNAFQVLLYQNLGTNDGLVPISTSALTFYKQNIKSTTNLPTGTISTIQDVPVNVGLRNIDGTLEISFDVQTA